MKPPAVAARAPHKPCGVLRHFTATAHPTAFCWRCALKLLRSVYAAHTALFGIMTFVVPTTVVYAAGFVARIGTK